VLIDSEQADQCRTRHRPGHLPRECDSAAARHGVTEMPRTQASRRARRDGGIARTIRKPNRARMAAAIALLLWSCPRLLVRHECHRIAGPAVAVAFGRTHSDRFRALLVPRGAGAELRIGGEESLAPVARIVELARNPGAPPERVASAPPRVTVVRTPRLQYSSVNQGPSRGRGTGVPLYGHAGHGDGGGWMRGV
jgi:hypothetical protein